MPGTPVRDDRVLPATRALSVFVFPFLVVAFAVLYPVPGDTGRLFAWPVKPSVTAMVLGAAYLGGAYFFLRAARAPRWHPIAGGFVPVGLFASLLGVATIVHWDRFNHTHVAFWLWAGLYFSTPVLVLGVWLANRRYGARPAEGDLLLPAPVAGVIATVGGLALLTGLFLFLLPARAIAVWPWTLTPLTARVLGAVFALGVAGLGVLRDRRWTSARVPLEVAGVMLALILVAAARARHEFTASTPLAWLLVAGFLAVTAGITVLYVRTALYARTVRAASAAR